MTRSPHDHLVPLFDGWSVWRWMRLRGAGFPAATVDEVSAPAAATAVDRYVAAIDAATAARDALIAACGTLHARSEPDARRELGKTLKRLRAGTIPDALPAGDPDVTTALERARTATEYVETCRKEVADLFESGRRDTARALRRVLASDAFREAVTWQNRHALRDGLLRLADAPIEATDKDTRKREAAVASYLQRYCVKNDTISFFGPISWGTFRLDGERVSLTPGRTLLANRTVYYEHWCMNALAQHLAQDGELLPWLKPCCSPTLRVEGNVVHSPIEQRSEVTPAVAHLLAACDGERSARSIAETALAADLGFSDEDDVLAHLAELAEQDLITWTLELPPEELYPERYLRGVIEQVGDPAVRARSLEKLEAFAQARDRVARAAGDPSALDAALAAFEETFTAVTGLPATRKHGQTYGGRTLLYEDCRRDVQFAIGGDVLGKVGPAMALVLASARWYTHAIATQYRAAIAPIYEALRQRTGSRTIDFRRFWDEIKPLFGGSNSIVDQVTAKLQERWREIFRIEPAARRCDRTSDELRAEVAQAFAAPGPGWPAARYQSPDILIAAKGADAFARGDYLVVVGEVHTGLNSVLVPVFVKEYPDAEQLVRAREADIATPSIAPVWSHERSRADMFSLARHDFALETGKTRSWRPRSQVIRESSLVVEEHAGQLEVRTRDGAHRFDIIAFLEHHLIAESHARFTLLGTSAHSPRVTVDGVVFSREKWHFGAGELPFTELATPLERFVAARQWAHGLGMPRRVFIKVPHETKPLYVDFASSVYIDNMAKMVRKATAVSISEMLPDIEETWLVDEQGRTYTSELRVVAVDPVRFTAPTS